jgi:hypothetical protein
VYATDCAAASVSSASIGQAGAGRLTLSDESLCALTARRQTSATAINSKAASGHASTAPRASAVKTTARASPASIAASSFAPLDAGNVAVSTA